MTVRLSRPPHADDRSFEERGFGQRIGFGRTPALLVIDLVKAFTDPERPLGAPLEGAVEATSRLLERAHGCGVPVFFSTLRYDDADLRDAGIWASKMRGVASLRADGDGGAIDPRLEVGPRDSVIVKKYASCFFGTDLLSRLVSHRIDTLVLAGCTTSGCVRATAVDACQHGLRPMVVVEAVGDRSSAAHEQSLFDLDTKYADVVDLASTLAYFDGLGLRARIFP